MTKRVQAGDTADFAVSFAALPDPEPSTAPLPAAGSWGRLEIWVCGRNLTEHRDRAGGLHEAVHWYLQPLVNWLLALRVSLDGLWTPIARGVERGVDYLAFGPAPEWAPQLQAERLDARLWRWRQRHALSSARHGGVVPEVVFRRSSDDIEVSWDSDHSPSRSRNRFLESRGCEWLSLECVECTLVELESLARQQGWAATNLGPCDDVAPFHSALRRSLPRPDWWMDERRRLWPLGLVAQGLDPDLEGGEAQQLTRAAPSVGVRTLPTLDVSSSQEAWQQGYDAALQLRRQMGLNDQPVPDLAGFADSLGVEVRELQISDRSIRSVAMTATDQDFGSVVAVNLGCEFNRDSNARRASVLQGLGHLLLDRTNTGRAGFAHGSRWNGTSRTRRANAFAAMLLAPPEALSRLTPDSVSVEEHCRTLGVSRTLFEKHAENLGRLPYGFSEFNEELDGH